MSGAFLAINGQRVVSAHIAIPYYGIWTGDAMIPQGSNLPAGTAVTVTLGNLSLKGTVYRSGAFAGQVKAFLMGGAGGWQTTVAAQAYALTGGVRLSMVLGDLATAVGEKVQIASDGVLGSTFAREKTQAGRILRQIAGSLWYIDASGVTQIRPSRPSSTITSGFQIVRYDGDKGEFEIATEDYASWQPGAAFSNVIVPTAQTVSLATIDTDNVGKLRFTVLTTGPQTDRLIEDIRAIVREEVESLTFLGVYEYAVQETDGVTVDAVPTSGTIPLPALRKVPLRSGLPGVSVKPGIGSLLAVSFLNGDPARAIVLGGYDGANAQSVQLYASPSTVATHSRPVVCYGDLVSVGSAAGALTSTGTASQRRVSVQDNLT